MRYFFCCIELCCVCEYLLVGLQAVHCLFVVFVYLISLVLTLCFE